MRCNTPCVTHHVCICWSNNKQLTTLLNTTSNLQVLSSLRTVWATVCPSEWQSSIEHLHRRFFVKRFLLREAGVYELTFRCVQDFPAVKQKVTRKYNKPEDNANMMRERHTRGTWKVSLRETESENTHNFPSLLSWPFSLSLSPLSKQAVSKQILIVSLEA